MDGVLKVFELALPIAIAWPLLSILSIAIWALLPEIGRRLRSRSASTPPARDERQPSAEVRAIYAHFGDDDVGDVEPVDCERAETAGTDGIVLIVGTNSRKR